MAAYRYWRIYVTGTEGGTTTAGVNNLLFASPLGAQLATGGTALASGSEVANTPDMAFDASQSTFWRSAAAASPASPQWLGYDFGSPVEVGLIQIRSNYGLLSWSYTPSVAGTELQVSDDGVTWFEHPNFYWQDVIDSYYQYITVSKVLVEDAEASQLWSEISTVQSAVYPSPVEPNPPLFDSVLEIPYPPSLPLYGEGSIAGTLKVLTVPSKRRVRLFERGSGVMVRETFSNTDGTYRFDYLDTRRDYFVVGFDEPQRYDPSYNAAIADMLRAGVAP